MRKINIDTFNREKFNDRSADHKYLNIPWLVNYLDTLHHEDPFVKQTLSKVLMVRPNVLPNSLSNLSLSNKTENWTQNI